MRAEIVLLLIFGRELFGDAFSFHLKARRHQRVYVRRNRQRPAREEFDDEWSFFPKLVDPTDDDFVEHTDERAEVDPTDDDFVEHTDERAEFNPTNDDFDEYTDERAEGQFRRNILNAYSSDDEYDDWVYGEMRSPASDFLANRPVPEDPLNNAEWRLWFLLTSFQTIRDLLVAIVSTKPGSALNNRADFTEPAQRRHSRSSPRTTNRASTIAGDSLFEDVIDGLASAFFWNDAGKNSSGYSYQSEDADPRQEMRSHPKDYPREVPSATTAGALRRELNDLGAERTELSRSLAEVEERVTVLAVTTALWETRLASAIADNQPREAAEVAEERLSAVSGQKEEAELLLVDIQADVKECVEEYEYLEAQLSEYEDRGSEYLGVDNKGMEERDFSIQTSIPAGRPEFINEGT